MEYNKDDILRVADPVAVASYIGLETKKRGSNHFILCPKHKEMIGKEDSNFGNCVLSKRGKPGFICYACGAHGDVFDLVAAYTGCSYPEALRIVGDICGGAESFAVSRKATYKRVIKMLPVEDLELIGLNTSISSEKSDEGRLLFNAVDKKEDETDKTGCVRRGEEFLLYQKADKINLQSLLRKDLDAYLFLIERKAKEAATKYSIARRECANKRSSIYKDILILTSPDGRLNEGSSIPKENIVGIQAALQKKRKRAEEIYEEYRKLREQRKK